MMTNSTAITDVVAERIRQYAVKGHSTNVDDRYVSGELAGAAASYAITAQIGAQVKASHGISADERYRALAPIACWKWSRDLWKPKNPRADLVRAAAFLRAAGLCETCRTPFKAGAEYDHVLPAALGGEPSLANCRAICSPCHKAKTADDVGRIRKADRQRDKASGAKASKASIPAPPKAEKPASRASLPPRPLYGEM